MKTTLHLPKPIIKSGKPVAILSLGEYESLIETMEVINDQKLLLRIASAINNLRKNRFFTHNEVFHPKRK